MLLLLTLLGCPSGDDSGTPSACADLDPTACAADDRCTVIRGREVTWPDTGGDPCYTLADEEPLGCRDADAVCTEAETFAAPSGGSCYWFRNGCLPAGFGDCAEDPASAGEC